MVEDVVAGTLLTWMTPHGPAMFPSNEYIAPVMPQKPLRYVAGPTTLGLGVRDPPRER